MTITLYRGSHPAPPGDCGNAERCLFEAYSWMVSGRHTDECPHGVSPVVHQFGMSLNDALGDEKRQELVRFLPNGSDRLAGTAGDGKDQTRGYMALDWLARVYVPAWLGLAGLAAEADALRDLPRIADPAAARSAMPVLAAAGSKAAWATAWDAAGAAAGAASLAAALDGVPDGALDEALDGALAAAWAWTAPWDAGGDAGLAAALAAAWAAASHALKSTVGQLYDSAITLYDQMITGEWPADRERGTLP